MIDDLSPLLTVGQLRQFAGISRSFAYRLVQSGRIRAVRLGRRSAIRIPREELRRFLLDRAVTSTTSNGVNTGSGA